MKIDLTTEERNLTSTQWVEYHNGTKRKSYNTLPTSNITAEAVTVDGFTLSQTDNAGVTTTNGRSYTAQGMIQTRMDGRGNTNTTAMDKAERTLTVTDAAGVRTLSYNAYGEQESDSLVADSVTHLITETRDDKGRSTGYTYAKNGTVQQTITTGYGSDGRIATAGFIHGGEEKVFSYEYMAGTHLLEKLTKPNGMTLTQSYEIQRDLLTGMAYHRGTTLVAQREYVYDTLGRPTARNTSRQGSVKNDIFGYNYRSELTTATVNGNNYAYDYDNIGNRETATESDITTNYTANELNQYTAMGDFTPTFDADGNQTLVKTTTGVWSITYDAENRPVSFTNTETNTVIECAYDHMGRRATKKVTIDGSITLHQRYLYRGYLQIACCDLTRSTPPCLWLITWDLSQPIASRPLAIQKDGTWYTYGWDLTKNICEVFGPAGYIRTAYTYTPYGQVASTGDIEQPMQWSSEYTDTELSLVYYNYRHYNPKQGQWLGRDIVQNNNEYAIANNNCIRIYDYVGAIGVRDFLQNGMELAAKAYCRTQQLSNIAKLKGIIWLYSGSEPVCSTSGGCEKITIIVEVGNPCDIYPKNKVGHTGIGIGDNYYDLGPDQAGEWIKFYKNENIQPWWRSDPDLAPFDAESLDNILNDIENHSINPTIAITFCACAKNAAKTEQYWKKKYQDMANGIKKEYSLIGLNCSTSVWESLGMFSFPTAYAPEDILNFIMLFQLRNQCGNKKWSMPHLDLILDDFKYKGRKTPSE